MQHDFQDKSGRPTRKDSSGNDCKDIGAYMVGIFCKNKKSQNQKMTKQYNYGFQDYSFPPYTHDNPMPNKWSGCSNDDFMAAYQLFKSRDGTYCLEERVPPIGMILFQVQLRSG